MGASKVSGKVMGAKSTFTLITRVLCTNDRNGNPRRGWLVSTPFTTAFIEEDYSGTHNLDVALIGAAASDPERAQYAITGTTSGPEINVSPAEFKRLKKEYA